MTWTHGYVSDVRYPAFFYKEMQPLWLSTTAELRGFSASAADQPFSFLELGCGVGINLLVAAACHPQASFVGVDFNEEHLAVAREAARVGGLSNVEFVHADFAAFATRNARQFDYVTCHGVWSWIAPQHRAAILKTATESLKPRGLFYLHYMCHPGSTDIAPLQHLMNLCAHHMPGAASPRQAQTGLMLLQKMAQSGAFADRPAMLRHLANMAKREPADIAHEFLTDHWTPQHSVDLHEEVAATGLTLIGSADAFNNLDVSLSIPGAMQALVAQTKVPALAETMKDLARNSHQRMDLFQKAPRTQEPDAFAARFGAMRFTLLPNAPQAGPVTFTTPIGPITGGEGIYTPLLARLSAGPVTGQELSEETAFSGKLADLLQSLQLLMMQGWAHPVLDSDPNAAARAQGLTRWFTDNGVALDVFAAGGTAAARA